MQHCSTLKEYAQYVARVRHYAANMSLNQAVECAVDMNENADHAIPVPNYVDENVSTKVVKIIQSYTGIVNKMVWRKF